MKRLAFLLMFAAGMLLALRKLTRPAAQAACERLEAGMPEWFPPKRMMVDLAEVKAQNARILELLEPADRPLG